MINTLNDFEFKSFIFDKSYTFDNSVTNHFYFTVTWAEKKWK